MNDSEQDWGGPYLQAAFLCERLLQEADGVISAIRIVDHVTVLQDGDASDTQSAPMRITLTLFLAFKSGRAQGTHALAVDLRQPSGTFAERRYKQKLYFTSGSEHGNTIVLPVDMTVRQEGVYWFGIYLDDRLVTRVPLHAEYQQSPEEIPL
jgi:hypothetical protein